MNQIEGQENTIEKLKYELRSSHSQSTDLESRLLEIDSSYFESSPSNLMYTKLREDWVRLNYLKRLVNLNKSESQEKRQLVY